MIIDYCEGEEEIKRREQLTRGPFLGYINPQGQIIDYSVLRGEPGHDNWRNPVTPYYLSFVSYLVLGDNLESYKEKAKTNPVFRKMYEKNKYDGFNNSVLRGPGDYGFNNLDYPSFIEYLNDNIKKVSNLRFSKDEWSRLKYDLMSFFEKCYSKKDFFYSFGRVIKVQSFKNVTKIMYRKYLQRNGYDNYDDEREFYREYCIVTLMSYFKDILVQYLGYDSIERAIPEYDINIENNIYWNSQGYTFSPIPSIFTSCSNINERFYNWLLMDWTVLRVPRMIWNEKEQKFVQESSIIDYYQTEKEIILGKEIESIKREVPKQHRREYFRK